MANMRLKKEIMGIVDNQINTNDPPCTKSTFLQLQKQGCSKTEAKEMIAAVLLEEMYDVLKNQEKYDEKRYESKLNELVNDDFIFDDVVQVLKDGKDEILQTKYKIYDALMGHNSKEAISLFMTVWDQIKQFVIDRFYTNDVNGHQVQPELIDVDAQTDFKYELFNWLQDMEMEFGNAKKDEERIRFCKDVLELFSWREDCPDNYKTAIGEAFNSLGKYKECDEWFESWLKVDSYNSNCINIYIFCLMMRNELERAKEIAEKHIDDSVRCTMENEIMFIRAQALYEATGDQEKAEKYQNKISEFQIEFCDESLKYGIENAKHQYVSEQKVKDQKVYPNEPCPCGSGKKYKKCCARN